jgi:hypothetical protein
MNKATINHFTRAFGNALLTAALFVRRSADCQTSKAEKVNSAYHTYDR